MDIARIMRKRRWTGRDAGVVLIESLLNDIQRPGGPNPVTQGHVDRITSTFETDGAWRDYEGYKALFYGVLDSFNTAAGYNRHRLYHGLARLLGRIREVTLVEGALMRIRTNGIDPEAVTLFDGFETLERLAADEAKRDEAQEWERRFITPAIRGICAHNALMRLIGEEWKLDRLAAGEAEVTPLNYHETVGTYNRNLQTLGKLVQTPEGTRMIHDLFPTLDSLEDAAPTAEAIAEVRKQIKRDKTARTVRHLWPLTERLLTSVRSGGNP